MTRKNPQIYEELGFEEAFSWDKKDSSPRFLVPNQKIKSVASLEAGLLEGTQKIMDKYNKYKFALNFYDNFFQNLCFKNKKEGKKILFHSMRFSHLILGSKKYFPLGLMAWGTRDRLFSLKNLIGYLNISDLYQYVYYYMKEKNIDYLYQLVEKLEEKLKASKPDYVAMWSIAFPIERVILVACKKLGIPILEIQHGSWSSHFLLPRTKGMVPDYLLVWGQHFKDLYVQKNILMPEEIYILGYPYKIHKIEPKENKKHVVYYLGQNFELHYKELLDLKLKTLAELNKICEKLNIDFFYRPHPEDDRELLRNKAPDIRLTPKHETIFDTIAKGDIFISFDSTSLVEAAMRNKIALQLTNYPLPVDNMEELGVCAKSFQNIEQLGAYLEKTIKNSNLSEVRFEFNNNYIETRYNPGQRFMEILNQIENN